MRYHFLITALVEPRRPSETLTRTCRVGTLLLVLGGLAGCAGFQAPDGSRHPVTSPPVVQAPPGSAEPVPLPTRAGDALIARGDMAAAVSVLREVVRERPDLVEARMSLARGLQGIGDFDGAVDELRAALRREPERADARLQLARALMAKHDWGAARSELETLLAREPDGLEANASAGLVSATLGDLDGAVEA